MHTLSEKALKGTVMNLASGIVIIARLTVPWCVFTTKDSCGILMNFAFLGYFCYGFEISFLAFPQINKSTKQNFRYDESFSEVLHLVNG